MSRPRYCQARSSRERYRRLVEDYRARRIDDSASAGEPPSEESGAPAQATATGKAGGKRRE